MGTKSPEDALGAVHSDERLPRSRRFAYGVGHVFNDLCASMWFTYLIVFYHMVLQISNVYAGLLILIGQIADAMATPIVGYFCDRTHNRYGGRKTWHLIGTAMVAVSFFFFWHNCIYCSNQPVGWQMLYWASFIVVFQFGWASVQVSHLALIPELTHHLSDRSGEAERVGLNSIRYAFTILSNVGVFVAMIVLLTTLGGSGSGIDVGSKVTPSDLWLFSGVALGIIAVGLIFSSVFHIGTKEPSSRTSVRLSSSVEIDDECTEKKWHYWFTQPQFYLVAVVYMCTRLVVNLTQVYLPLYFLDSLDMYRLSIAIAPLVVFSCGLLATVFLKWINVRIGRNLTYVAGLAIVAISLVWLFFWPSSRPLLGSLVVHNFIYGATILLGIGGSTLLVTSLSMVADLIGKHCASSAFVYGAMSLTDKLSNGIAIQVIQALHPCRGSGSDVCCSACSSFYRYVVVFAPGGACVLALVAILALIFLYRKQALSRSSRGPSRHYPTVQESDSETEPLIKS